FGPTKSMVLWLRHVLEVERETRGQARCFVAYEDLLRDWRSVAARLAEELDFAWPKFTHAAEVRVDQFLSDAPRHHRFTDYELAARADVAKWVKQTYAAA